MGGQKKKSLSQKSRSHSDSAKDGKKSDKPEGGSQRAEITVKINDKQAQGIVRRSKVITVQELARQTGVKISTANTFLRRCVEDGSIRKVAGRSGHYIYQAA